MANIEDSPRWVRIYKEKQLIADSKRVKLDYTRGAYCFPIDDIKVDPKSIKGSNTVLELPDHYSFDWEAMDAWFEEDEQIFVHPRMPNHRTDCVQSSRHIEVFIDGTKVADTHRPTLLFETGLPTRHYIPQHDCRLDLLESSNTLSRCPYKGEAHYYSINVNNTLHKDLIWYYRFPLHEAAGVRDLLCFFNEKVDIHEDGKLLPRPETPWS